MANTHVNPMCNNQGNEKSRSAGLFSSFALYVYVLTCVSLSVVGTYAALMQHSSEDKALARPRHANLDPSASVSGAAGFFHSSPTFVHLCVIPLTQSCGINPGK